MGSRTNFELKDENGSVWLYSHSGGDDKAVDLATALDKAEPRWGDTPYAIRIVVSQLIGNRWDIETGFGLSSFESGEESYSPICVNFPTKTVNYEEREYTFAEFINSFSNIETFTNRLTKS